ncbi:MAG TPA: cofactor-independent phosphoglycerate mutase [Chthonomonadaceae bacterium]|nr:cofactor-independent phosphoglycerate mutase [Chthonomonadaceae bacterium]
MKYLLLVPDGAADLPLADLDGKTPLEVARTPYLDDLARSGLVGAVQVTPETMYPGSDAANMALLGYDPGVFYTGRGPIEAAAMGLPMDARDVAFRCSLISTDGETLLDYSAGHISTEEARPLIELANSKLGTRAISLFPGVSYRHILRWHDGPTELQTHPPHENMGRRLAEIYPAGEGESRLRALIDDSINLLDDLPFNRMRRSEGKPAANTLWPWSPGRLPQMPSFLARRGVTGAVISAVDVVRGLGRLTGLEVVDVPGATGYFDTNYEGKAAYALRALDRHDFVWVHVEAPDEAGHAGSVDEKIKAIENFDGRMLGPLLDGMKRLDDFRLLCAPDHMTPVSTRGHAVGPVPFLLFDSRKPMRGGGHLPYDERALQETKTRLPEGHRLIDELFAD